MSDPNLPPIDPAKGAWDEKELSRRNFLEGAFFTVTGIAAVGVVGAGGRFLVGESLEPRTASWVKIGSVADLKAGTVHMVNYAMKVRDAWRDIQQKGTLYAFSTDGARYQVLDGTCTHLGCIVKWDNAEGAFACPCHSARFTRDGVVVSGPPPKALRTLETKVEDGALWARI
ncbi:MAG: Rieske (2Fe-2S) protein [Thermoflexales bacterium]|nr:Rieske (2Fe-2S) protein [Thermoflexales bacterium]